MKQLLILFYLVHLTNLASAQDKETSPYLFDNFQEAVVFFKDGSQYHEKMNYNLLVEKFYFIDRSDNKLKVLSNPQDINIIKFGNRVFYTKAGKGIEILPTNPALHVQYKGNIRKEATKGAYGKTSETTSVRTYGGTYGSSGERLDFDPEKLVLGSRYNIYWLERKGKKKSFKNLKQFIKLYPNHEGELQNFIHENKIDFNNAKQISILCIHAESL